MAELAKSREEYLDDDGDDQNDHEVGETWARKVGEDCKETAERREASITVQKLCHLRPHCKTRDGERQLLARPRRYGVV